jgi:hypothetical protein
MLPVKITPRLVNALAIATCLIGFVLRLYFYGINRSLWLDEAMLALNLVNRSFLDLLKPLDYNQGAPVGYLILQKAVVSLLGSRDYTLRLIPLLAGLASIPLMYSVSKQYSRGLAPFISLGLFAMSAKLVYYSSELKQYSTDIMVTLLLLSITPKCLEDKVNPRVFVALGIMGILAIWISHPALFIFVGIVLTLGITFAKQRNLYRLLWLIGIGGVWTTNLILVYVISLRALASNNKLLNYWSGHFAPLPPWSNLVWYYNALVDMLINFAALPVNPITIGLLIIGIFSYALRRWQLMSMLITPCLLTLIASAFRKYPFNGRLLLFVSPLVLLVVAEGVERIRMVLMRVNRPLSLIVSISLCIYICYTPIIGAYTNIQVPPMVEHIKPVMSYISKNHQRNDVIYIYYCARPAFEFYAPLYEFDGIDYVFGVSSQNDPGKYLQNMNALKGNQRIWFLFSHNCSWCRVNEERFFLEHLNEIGLKKDEFIGSGASVYLYDLAPPPYSDP